MDLRTARSSLVLWKRRMTSLWLDPAEPDDLAAQPEKVAARAKRKIAGKRASRFMIPPCSRNRMSGDAKGICPSALRVCPSALRMDIEAFPPSTAPTTLFLFDPGFVAAPVLLKLDHTGYFPLERGLANRALREPAKARDRGLRYKRQARASEGSGAPRPVDFPGRKVARKKAGLKKKKGLRRIASGSTWRQR